MNYEVFKESVQELIEQTVGGDVCVQIHTIPKNNGVVREGMTILKKGANMSPTLYLDTYFERCQQGLDVRAVVAQMLRDYEQGGVPDIPSDFFTDFQKAKDHICYKLVHTQKNQQLLSEIPHLELMDLSIVFYYKVEEPDGAGATILIRENHRKHWGITLEELYELAKRNTMIKLPPLFQTMSQVICSIAKEEFPQWEVTASEEPDDMYVLTNQEKYLGAGCILYPDILEKVAAVLKCNFYILPSSIHECIIMPDSGEVQLSQLADLVSEMNAEYLDEEEVLSDQIYYYHRGKKELREAV